MLGRQAHRRDDLLQHRPERLNHRDAVGRLHPRALELVVEDRVFVRRQVEPRGVLHHADADVAREAVGQQRVEVADRPPEHRRRRRPARTPPLPGTRSLAAAAGR